MTLTVMRAMGIFVGWRLQNRGTKSSSYRGRAIITWRLPRVLINVCDVRERATARTAQTMDRSTFLQIFQR